MEARVVALDTFKVELNVVAFATSKVELNVAVLATFNKPFNEVVFDTSSVEHLPFCLYERNKNGRPLG